MDIVSLPMTGSSRIQCEIVERKGLGHPDTLADGAAEAASVAYSLYCLKHLGVILHHNFDKLYLRGGQANLESPEHRMLSPIECFINGRASVTFGCVEIPVGEIVSKAVASYLSTRLPHIDVQKDVRIHNYTFTHAHRPRWCRPLDINDLPEMHTPYSNDTSVTFSAWPLSDLEKLVLNLAACRRDFFSATPICGKLWANSDDSNALIARSEAHGPQIQTG